MPDIFHRVGSTWKRTARLFVRVGASWKTVANAWVRVGGAWKLVFTSTAPGEAYWTDDGTTTWTVPAGVYQVYALVIAAGYSGASAVIRRGSTVLLSNTSALGAAVGGGNGGSAGSGRGGGAGGYSGNGGNAGASGNGGGGAGGNRTYPDGGGTYFRGAGASGTSSTANRDALHGSNLGASIQDVAPFGGGYRGYAGGNLRYTITPLSVTPGETLTVAINNNGQPAMLGGSSGGAARVIWGGGLSYPDNAVVK